MRFLFVRRYAGVVISLFFFGTALQYTTFRGQRVIGIFFANRVSTTIIVFAAGLGAKPDGSVGKIGGAKDRFAQLVAPALIASLCAGLPDTQVVAALTR